VPRPEGRDPNAERPEAGNAKYLRETRWVCRRVESAVADALEEGTTPLVLGGDHSIAIGSVNGASSDRDVGVLWLDAHGDFNTPETTPSGNVHGMPVAAFLGRGAFGDMDWATADVEESNVAMVGLRSIDGDERTALRNSDVSAFTMSDIDTRGLVPVVEDAIEAALDGVDALHVSLDMDFLDPDEAPGVGTPVRGGVTYREAHAAMELVAETGALRSMEVVEVNPILDAHNRTADLAVELVASSLGKRIL
jgi:arginase